MKSDHSRPGGVNRALALLPIFPLLVLQIDENGPLPQKILLDLEPKNGSHLPGPEGPGHGTLISTGVYDVLD